MHTQRPNALDLTRPSRSGCNPRVPQAGALNLSKPPVNATILIVLLAAAFLPGCDPMARESIKVRLPNAMEAENAKTAIALIELVLKKHDFQPQQNATQIDDATLVAVYQNAVENNLVCVIHHRKGKIEIELNEFGRFRLDPTGTRTKIDLIGKLVEKFGKEEISR